MLNIHLFMYLLGIHIIYLLCIGDYSGPLSVFKIGLCVCLPLSCMRRLYILDINALGDTWFATIFLHNQIQPWPFDKCPSISANLQPLFLWKLYFSKKPSFSILSQADFFLIWRAHTPFLDRHLKLIPWLLATPGKPTPFPSLIIPISVTIWVWLFIRNHHSPTLKRKVIARLGESILIATIGTLWEWL